LAPVVRVRNIVSLAMYTHLAFLSEPDPIHSQGKILGNGSYGKESYVFIKLIFGGNVLVKLCGSPGDELYHNNFSEIGILIQSKFKTCKPKCSTNMENSKLDIYIF
jgi:hypothetical protein